MLIFFLSHSAFGGVVSWLSVLIGHPKLYISSASFVLPLPIQKEEEEGRQLWICIFLAPLRSGAAVGAPAKRRHRPWVGPSSALDLPTPPRPSPGVGVCADPGPGVGLARDRCRRAGGVLLSAARGEGSST